MPWHFCLKFGRRPFSPGRSCEKYRLTRPRRLRSAGRMGFRFKAFALHLAGSASALTLTLGLLYLGWYHWPGWYLADLPTVLAIMVGVHVVLGPLLTFIVAE